MKVVSVKLPDSLIEKLDRFCKKHNLQRSEAIRLAIQKLIKEGVKLEGEPDD